MEESKFYRSTSGSPSSVMGGGLFMSPGRTQDCTLHGSALQRHHTTYATVGLSISLPASSTSELRYPTTAGAHSRYYRSSLGGRLGKGSMPGDMLPQPQRARSAYVGVFRHAPCTRGFKDMLWEPSFSAARPALTQMDLAKQMRFKARHVDQLELQQLPALLYKEYKGRKDNDDGLDLSTSGGKDDDDLVEIDDVFLGGDLWSERLPRSEGDTPDGQADDKCCVICIETYTPWDLVRVLPKCKHVFHKRCIDMWLRGVCSYEACFTRSCPMCKTAIDFTSTQEQDGSSSLTQQRSHLSRGFRGRRNMRAPAMTTSALGSFDPHNIVASSSSSRSSDEPTAGFMSALRDAIPHIPRWAYARAGDALLRGTSAQERPRAYSGSQTGSQGSAPPYVSAALQ